MLKRFRKILMISVSLTIILCSNIIKAETYRTTDESGLLTLSTRIGVVIVAEDIHEIEGKPISEDKDSKILVQYKCEEFIADRDQFLLDRRERIEYKVDTYTVDYMKGMLNEFLDENLNTMDVDYIYLNMAYQEILRYIIKLYVSLDAKYKSESGNLKHYYEDKTINCRSGSAIIARMLDKTSIPYNAEDKSHMKLEVQDEDGEWYSLDSTWYNFGGEEINPDLQYYLKDKSSKSYIRNNGKIEDVEEKNILEYISPTIKEGKVIGDTMIKVYIK